jgi:response regulator RpfG family c-di-GMP phosphodiesterase
MRVLIVDNDADTVRLIRKTVDRIGQCSTIVYPDAAAVRPDLHKLDFDIALVSYRPQASGLVLAARIRESAKHAEVPVVVMTGDHDRPEARVDAFEGGAAEVLSKPLEPLELRIRIRNLLALREAQLASANRTQWLKVEVMRATEQLRTREREIVLRLCRAIDCHDSETSDHIGRMAKYSQIIARELGFPAETCEFLYLAAHMHDVGKLGVPAELLKKPARLTPEERVELEQHTLFGEEILEGSSSPLIQLAAIIAGSHHEKWDGTGYPRQLKGSDIPIAGRIAAVADVFDALTTTRRYKDSWSIEDSRQYLVDERGKHFDPACVDAFLRRWDEVLAIYSGRSDNVLAA